MVKRITDTEARAFDALGRAIHQFSAADARLRGRVTRKPGELSLTHARALRILAERGPQSVTALAEGTETSTPAVTQLLRGLTAVGYVDKHEADDDRRKVSVSLTEDGLARHRQRDALFKTWMHEELSDYSPDELKVAADILVRLCDLFDTL